MRFEPLTSGLGKTEAPLYYRGQQNTYTIYFILESDQFTHYKLQNTKQPLASKKQHNKIY